MQYNIKLFRCKRGVTCATGLQESKKPREKGVPSEDGDDGDDGYDESGRSFWNILSTIFTANSIAFRVY
jgi:hypothetical protein